MRAFRSALFRATVLCRAPLGRRIAPSRLPRVCRAYKPIRRDDGREGTGEGSEEGGYEMPDIQQFSMGGDWNISPKEWHVLQRVADQLFPEGIIDWEDFWSKDDYEEWYPKWRHLLEQEGGLDPSLPQYEESEDGQRMWLIKAMKYLETREDYIEMMPQDWAAGKIKDDPPTPAKEFDPDWNDWDFRAYMEKRRARERDRRAWRRKQREELGKYNYVDTISIDMRFSEEDREAYNWTDEEIWDLITQNGRAFDPRKDKGPWKELNPDELPDWAAEGVEYTEEIDEYMMKRDLIVDDEDFFRRENERLAAAAAAAAGDDGEVDGEVVAEEPDEELYEEDVTS